MIASVEGTDDRHGDASDGIDDLEAQIAAALTRTKRTAASAESLTGGSVSAGLSAIEGASDWFLGGVVAYAAEVKFRLLGVDRGPVINARTAERMATGVARLLHADFAVATTGVGGPGPLGGRSEGTVFIAVATPDGCTAHEYAFDGDPSQIIALATRQALRDLAAAVTDSAVPSGQLSKT
jgi:nicotinamide-nucleotide amidase